MDSILLSMLSITAEENEKDWDLKVPTTILVYHSSVHESTVETPFSLMLGREAQLHVDIIYGLPEENVSSE